MSGLAHDQAEKLLNAEKQVADYQVELKHVCTLLLILFTHSLTVLLPFFISETSK